jgi:signal transduction histidine kinase
MISPDSEKDRGISGIPACVHVLESVIVRVRGRFASAEGQRLGISDFAVPALLAFAQITGTWLLTWGMDRPIERERWMVVVAAILGCNAALIWRRISPVPVLGVTLALGAAGTLAVGTTEVVAGGVADGVALFSLAVHRGRRQAMIGCAVTYAVMSVAFAPVREGAAALLTNGILDAAAYTAITALGQLRRQRKARRLELAERLAAAERERRDAAGAERERLARDLHDVAGHHLSAVVVHSTAASRIDDPDLTGRALTAAADTGRDVLKALGRLVDVVGGPESGEGRLDVMLPPLCQGLTRLGVPVSLSVEGSRRLRPQVTNAVYRIVQEALTNAMRYAQGAAVAVEVRHGSGEVEVVVRNAAPPEEIPVPAMGGGRGIAGMRERAGSLGGVLTAGPDEDTGGWQVRAILPTSASTRRGPGWPEVLDGATIGLCVALPSVLALAPPEPLLGGWTLGGTVLAMTAVVGRALPLWWRRRAPYTVLAALIVIDCVWAVVAGALGSGMMLALLFFGGAAAMIAVSSVGCYARQSLPTWPAPLLAGVPAGVTFGAAAVNEDGPAHPGEVAMLGLIVWLFAVLLLLPFWAWGRTIAGRGVQWEADALEIMAARTGEAVVAERHRIAMGLRATVLKHTARLVRAAEDGMAAAEADAQKALADVAEHARAALTDMRALLDALQEDGEITRAETVK